MFAHLASVLSSSVYTHTSLIHLCPVSFFSGTWCFSSLCVANSIPYMSSTLGVFTLAYPVWFHYPSQQDASSLMTQCGICLGAQNFSELFFLMSGHISLPVLGKFPSWFGLLFWSFIHLFYLIPLSILSSNSVTDICI